MEDPAWRRMEHDGFNAYIGEIELAPLPDRALRFRLTVGPQHINMGGVCHGGVLMTLADIGMGQTVWEMRGRRPCTTVEFGGRFVAAAKRGQILDGRSRIVRETRDLSFMACEIHADGRLVFTAGGIWKHLADGPAR